MPNQRPVQSVPEFLPRNNVFKFTNEWSCIFSPSIQRRVVNRDYICFYFKGTNYLIIRLARKVTSKIQK